MSNGHELNINRIALNATSYCLAGCSIGEFTGMVPAGIAAFPVNRWLIIRGRGHANFHKNHGQHANWKGATCVTEFLLPAAQRIGWTCCLMLNHLFHSYPDIDDSCVRRKL